MTSFYIKFNTGLKWVHRKYVTRASRQSTNTCPNSIPKVLEQRTQTLPRLYCWLLSLHIHVATDLYPKQCIFGERYLKDFVLTHSFPMHPFSTP